MQIMDFSPLIPTQTLMAGYPHQWCFGGGWALDGLIGKVTRLHADVDIVIWRADQKAFRAQFADWDWQTYINREPHPWPAEEFLELPAKAGTNRTKNCCKPMPSAAPSLCWPSLPSKTSPRPHGFTQPHWC